MSGKITLLERGALTPAAVQLAEQLNGMSPDAPWSESEPLRHYQSCVTDKAGFMSPAQYFRDHPRKSQVLAEAAGRSRGRV